MTSRRKFLLDSLAAVSAVGVAPALVWSAPRPARAKRVLIAGAGAAGLCAAWELTRAGHEVLVFEPRTIPGGRILTLRSPFADGLYAEAGAMYLGSNTLAVEYARQFDLPLEQLRFRADVGSVAHLAGVRVALRSGQPVNWPIALDPDDAGQSMRALQTRYFRSRIADVEGGLEGLNAADWPRPAHLPWDDISLAELWPWALGDFSCFKPGQIRAFFPHLQRPEGRVYLAGDTIGGIPGYIEGAMRSARSVVEHIARASEGP